MNESKSFNKKRAAVIAATTLLLTLGIVAAFYFFNNSANNSNSTFSSVGENNSVAITNETQGTQNGATSSQALPQTAAEVYSYPYTNFERSSFENVKHAMNVAVADAKAKDEGKKTENEANSSNATEGGFCSSNANDVFWKIENGVLYISKIQLDEKYKGFDSATAELPGWFDDRLNIKKVVVDKDNPVHPEKTAFWFSCTPSTGVVPLSNIETIENTNYIYMDKVSDAQFMFAGCWKLNPDTLLPSNMGNVKNAFAMFDYSNFSNAKLNEAVSTILTPTNTAFMFADCANLEDIVLANMNFSAVTNMSNMFARDKNLTAVLEANDKKAQVASSANCMFDGCTSLSTVDIKSLIQPNVTQIAGMFANCNLTDLDISGWKTTDENGNLSLIYVQETFAGNKNLKTIMASPSTDWSSLSAKMSQDIFKGCNALVGGNGKKFDNADVSFAKVDYYAENHEHDGYFTCGDAEAKTLTYDWEAYGDYKQVVPKDRAFTVQGATELPTPSKTGMIFEGWTDNGTDIYTAGTEFNPSDNTVLAPVFSEDKADYSGLDAAIAAADAVDRSLYTDDSLAVLDKAVDKGKALSRDLPKSEQPTVDAVAKEITDAIDNLVLKGADYSAVDAAIARAAALDRDIYTEDSLKAVDDAVAAVERGLPITRQAEVNAMAKAINDACDNLVLKGADYSAVDAAIARVAALDRSLYTQESLDRVDAAVEAVEYDLPITRQDEVNAMAKAINDACDALQEIADYSEFDAAVETAKDRFENHKDWYNAEQLDALEKAIETAEKFNHDLPKTAENQELIDNATDAINAASDNMQPADYSGLNDKIDEAQTYLDQSSKYTGDSIKALQDAVDDAKVLPKDLKIKDQGQIQTAIDNIQTAIDGLEEKTTRELTVDPGYSFTIYKGLNDTVNIKVTPDPVLDTDSYSCSEVTGLGGAFAEPTDTGAKLDVTGVATSGTATFSITVSDTSGTYSDSTVNMSVTVSPWQFATVSGDNVSATKYIGTATSVTVPSSAYKYTASENDEENTKTTCTVTGVGTPAATVATQCVNSNLTTVTLNNKITDIYPYAFAGTNSVAGKLTKITNTSQVINVGGHAFEYCTGLTQFGTENYKYLINSSLQSIGDNAFAYCGSAVDTLTSLNVEMPDDASNLSTIGKYAFRNTGLWSITLKYAKATTLTATFYGSARLRGVSLPSGCTTIASDGTNGTFDSCTEKFVVTNTSNVKNIGTYSFWNSGLTQFGDKYGVVQLRKDVIVDNNGFTNAKQIKYVVVGYELNSQGVVSAKIGNSAFSSCSDLTTYVVRAAQGNDQIQYGTTPFNSAGSTSSHAKLFIAGGTATKSVAIPDTAKYYIFSWVSSVTSATSSVNGYYYQLNTTNTSKTITQGGLWSVGSSSTTVDCVIDLNGITLDRKATSGTNPCIKVYNNCTFSLEDTSVVEESTMPSSSTVPDSQLGKLTGGYTTGTNGGGIDCSGYSNQTVNIRNGQISGCHGGQGGAVFLATSSKLYIYNGKIRQNTAEGSGGYSSGGVFGQKGCSMYMYGGEISYNNGAHTKGCGVWLNSVLTTSTLYMYGGYIRNNHCKSFTSGTEYGVHSDANIIKGTGVTQGTAGDYSKGNYIVA